MPRGYFKNTNIPIAGMTGKTAYNKGVNSFSVKQCLTCNNDFTVGGTTNRNRKQKFCSKKCDRNNGKKRGGWNKGMKGVYLLSEEHKQKISNALKGKMPKNIDQIKGWNKGRIGDKASEETKRKMRINAQRGEKNVNWKGGITPENHRIRKSIEYKDWRKSVLKKDNYTCQNCEKRGNGELNADHIKPFSLFPELRLDINNGRTLCRECHKKIGWELFRENNPKKKQYATT